MEINYEGSPVEIASTIEEVNLMELTLPPSRTSGLAQASRYSNSTSRTPNPEPIITSGALSPDTRGAKNEESKTPCLMATPSA